MPSWRGDILRALGCAVFCVVLVWPLILLVRWRLLHYDNLEIIEDTDIWAAILASLISLMLPFLLLAPKRPDLGFRYSSVPFLPQIVVVGGAVHTVSMLVWPWLVGADLVPGTVLAELASDPVALVTAAALVFTWSCVFLLLLVVILLASERMKWITGVILLIPFLGAIFGAGLTAVRTFDNPPSITACLVWVLLGIVALVLLTGMDLLRTHLHRRAQRRESRWQAALPYRPSLEELGWKPR
ncbi:hypothetical protein [Brevibacterium yomogidense]|uniref:hypothetical protein n=1 Tax=Brevibacterium yomogidense TaxID=946573 RepID=UPI0018DF1091|nr:hypothetical protein [Brevibacterium yomogidense]